MRSFSQVASHTIYGGVVPELASREHAQQILHVLFHLIMDPHNDGNNGDDNSNDNSNDNVDFFSNILRNEKDDILR